MLEKCEDLKYNFIIFSDIDGTINLKDENLKRKLTSIDRYKGIFIPVTGRTIGDIKGKFEKNNLPISKYIVGDNGGGIYYTPESRFLERKNIDQIQLQNIIDICNNEQINLEHLRYTDGENIHVSSNLEVRSYYEGNKKVLNTTNIVRDIEEKKDVITKVTLVGSKTQMEKIRQSIENKKLWGHLDKTEFPKSSFKNYRLDITKENINKGEAVKNIANLLNPKIGYVVLGNGYNDISMFKQAVDDGMIAGIIDNLETEEMIFEMQEYARAKTGKIIKIKETTNFGNEFIDKILDLFSEKVANENKETEEYIR